MQKLHTGTLQAYKVL